MVTIDHNLDSLSASSLPKYILKNLKSQTGQLSLEFRNPSSLGKFYEYNSSSVSEIPIYQQSSKYLELQKKLNKLNNQYYSTSVSELSVYQQNPIYLESQKKFADKLVELITSEPIEDGYLHPADELIEEAITKYSAVTASDWIQLTYNKNIVLKPSISAGILRCVGRLPIEMSFSWGFLMAITGLKTDDLEIRESAVRAFENWGGKYSLKALKHHVKSERKPWLVEYINQVIKDLSD
jgi:hypothetical protein